MIMPIVLPMPVKQAVYQPSGPAKFIETTDGEFFNISMTYRCGAYKSGSQWWIWFKILNGPSYYYMYPFQTEEEAKKHLLDILEK